MHWRSTLVAGAIGFAGLSAPAFADDSGDMKAEMKDMQRRLEAQDRKIRELEGKAPTQDEIAASVDRYLASAQNAVLVGGGGGADGSAGWPLGKKPFIKEGPNKLEFAFREQTRYEWFHYSNHSKGVLQTPANTPSDATPRDRSGFEIARLYFGIEGQVFCDDITYKLELGFNSNTGTGVEKNYMYVDWKYSGENHIRAGSDKAPYCLEENTSSSAQAFVDRNIVTKAFEIGFNTGVTGWGYLGSCDCPKQFMYKVQASNGEGRVSQEGQVFSGDAFDTYSDQLLFAGFFEWNITCKDWKWDEVDSRPCDDRCNLNASLGVGGYYEDDNDYKHFAPGGLALRNPNDTLERYGLDAWFRAQWNGWSLEAEGLYRNINYKRKADGTKDTAPDQSDYGADVTLHYRFPDTNWGVAVRGGMIWLDSDYRSVSFTSGSGTSAVTHTQKIADTISEIGLAVNYFFWDHNNKITADVNWVQDNSGVSSSKPGYVVGASKGVIIEDGIMFRVQWQLNF